MAPGEARRPDMRLRSLAAIAVAVPALKAGGMLWSAASAGVGDQGIQRFDSGAVRLWVEIWVETAVARSLCKPVQRSPVVCILMLDTDGWSVRVSLRTVDGSEARRAANSGLSPLVQGHAHIAEPRVGDRDPFPAVRGLGGGRDVGQSRVQLGQLEAPLRPGLKSPREVASSRSRSASR